MKNQNPISWLLSFFYPCRCPFCGKVIQPNKRICEECSSLISTDCRKFFVGNRWLCTSPFKYNSLAKRAVFQLKYGDFGQTASPMAGYMLDSLRENFSEYSFEIITFVPMDKRRRKKSLYNHSKLLAKEISKELSKPLLPLLIKTKHNKLQHTLTPEERLLNVKDAYSINPRFKASVKGKTVLLCDDVMTTGATLSECCKVLEAAGAEDIFCVTFAKA